MHDTMMKMEEIRELKNTLLDTVKAEIAKGVQCVDTKEAGEVIDMIKDLAETEKCYMEALYYQKVTEAMLSYEEPRYGYNPNRSASTGRYTSGGGRGGRMGFKPHEPWMPEDPWDGGSYGGGNSSMGYWSGREGMDQMDPRYGEEYNRYRMTRRHYTETKSAEDKKEMSEHAEKHLRDSIDTMKDIWGDAEPELKRKMKEDLTKLVNSMNM